MRAKSWRGNLARELADLKVDVLFIRRHPPPRSYFTHLRMRVSPWLVAGMPLKGSASSPRPVPRSPHRLRVPATPHRFPIARVRASAPAGTAARPVLAIGFLSIPHAADEGPLRACAQR